MRSIAVLLVAGLLCGCTARDPYVTAAAGVASGNWRIERQIDRITGAPSSSAMLITASSSHSSAPYPKPAGLQLTCYEKRPLVRLSFNFKVGADANTVLGYRFDDRPGQDNVAARVLQGYQIVIIEDQAAVARFIGELAGAKTLYVRIRSLNAGRTSAEFQLDGAAAAVQAAFADCPLPNAEAAPRRTQS